MRTTATVKVGLSAGERAKKKTNLEAVVTQQKELLQQGQEGILVSLPNFYNALKDWGRAAGIDSPEQYWINPESPQAQERQQQNQEQQQQRETMQVQLAALSNQQLQQTEQIKQQGEAQDRQAKAQQEQAEIQFKYFDALLDAEIAQAKIVGDATKAFNLETIKQQAAARSGNGGIDTAGNGRDTGAA